MSDALEKPERSGFDKITCVMAVASLLGSLVSSFMILPGGKIGFYFGTFFILVVLVGLQVLGLLFGVGLPALVLLFKRRLTLSPGNRWLLAIAIALLVAEVLALCLIPVTGSS